MGFPGGTVGKNPPAMQEMQQTQVQSLGGEDPLEEDVATHSSNLAGEIPWTEEPGGVQSMGSQRVGNDGVTNINTQVCFKKERPYTFIFVQHRASEM